MIVSAAISTFVAVAFDTEHYAPGRDHLVITPWNNVVYNSNTDNLAQHGLHPYWQHILVNLPQLLGPALPLFLFKWRRSIQLSSALGAIFAISCFRHQEARFLVPVIPLILTSIDLPRDLNRMWVRVALLTWIVFNVLLGLLMGIFHEGGVVPAQLWISRQDHDLKTFWWKTYSPPTYLLGPTGHRDGEATIDLMGMPGEMMLAAVIPATQCGPHSSTLLVVPLSATFLDVFPRNVTSDSDSASITLDLLWSYSNHFNLNDMEFADDGVWPTLQRVVGRRGLGIYQVYRGCKSAHPLAGMPPEALPIAA